MVIIETNCVKDKQILCLINSRFKGGLKRDLEKLLKVYVGLTYAIIINPISKKIREIIEDTR